MAARSLEERVAILEEQMQSVLGQAGGPKDWRRTVGAFTGDEVMKRIDDAAMKYRETDRAKGRRRVVKAKQTKR